MYQSFQELLPKDFSPQSRVWIYQSNRLFTLGEALEIEALLDEFVREWKSHGAPVKGYANLLFGRFIVLMADETRITVGGCSTDSSVRMVKALEQQFSVNFFDRQMLAFLVKDKIALLPLSQVPYALENHFISPDTVYFNNLVNTKSDLETQWMVSLKDSWLYRKISQNTVS